jgi:hypothetical protein
MENIQGVTWQDTFPKANDVAIVVILRGLDQNYPKFFNRFLLIRHAALRELVSVADISYR